MSDRKDDTAGIRESVEHEYGQLTFFKRQLECNMQMQNLGVRNLDPWMPRAIYDDAVAIREGIAGRDEAPSREDVAFGEMVYQRQMAEMSMLDSQGRLTDDDDYAATNYKDKGNGGREEGFPSRGEVGKNDFAPHHPDQYSKSHDIAYKQSYSKAKTKKRRKRRVVETITRVIHEESEEEGSASTGVSRDLRKRYS
jgi:hypothetical protein